jgi:hypothetical protein
MEEQIEIKTPKAGTIISIDGRRALVQDVETRNQKLSDNALESVQIQIDAVYV